MDPITLWIFTTLLSMNGIEQPTMEETSYYLLQTGLIEWFCGIFLLIIIAIVAVFIVTVTEVVKNDQDDFDEWF